MFHGSRSPWFHLLGGPVLWGIYFLIAYMWVEFACRVDILELNSTWLRLPILSWIVLLITIIFTLAAMYVGWSAFKNWQTLKKKRQETESTSWEIEAKQFMSFGGIVLGILFSLTILFSGLPVLALNPCS